EVPAHHNAEAYVDAYLESAGIRDEKKTPLFRSVDNRRRITENPMTRTDVLRMVKRRAIEAGLPSSTCCHTFRATGITAYLENGATIENAQAIAAHESPRTTKLYDRTSDEITLDEVERIAIESTRGGSVVPVVVGVSKTKRPGCYSDPSKVVRNWWRLGEPAIDEPKAPA